MWVSSCVCMCVHMCGGACVCVCMHVWWPEDNLWCHFLGATTLFLILVFPLFFLYIFILCIWICIHVCLCTICVHCPRRCTTQAASTEAMCSSFSMLTSHLLLSSGGSVMCSCASDGHLFCGFCWTYFHVLTGPFVHLGGNVHFHLLLISPFHYNFYRWAFKTFVTGLVCNIFSYRRGCLFILFMERQFLWSIEF